MVLRIGYVREHFCSPLLQYEAQDKDTTFTLIECPSGTGQLISRLANDEIDVAIALTDALIAGIAKGSAAYKLVGSFVASPLRWAVITGHTPSAYNQISDLQGTTLGISRIGSGSHTMAYVMAMQHGWPTNELELKFRVNNDIRGLIDSVNDGTTSAFMWEWFTTKPFVDAGECRFIGQVPTPWPSWLIAAHPTRAAPGDVRAFLDGLSAHVRAFAAVDSDEGRAASTRFVRETFGYAAEDVEEWFGAVEYPTDCALISWQVIMDTLSVLQEAGVVAAGAGDVERARFLAMDVVRLVGEAD